MISCIQQRLIISELHYVEAHLFQVLIVTVLVIALALPLAARARELPLHGWMTLMTLKLCKFADTGDDLEANVMSCL